MPDLAELLLSSNDLEWTQLESVRAQQAYTGKRIEHILVDNQMIPEARLTEAIARVTSVRQVNLDAMPTDAEALTKLRLDHCEEDVIFPVAVRDNGRTLWVAVTDPTDLGLLDRVGQRAGARVRPLVAGVNEIRRAIAKHLRREIAGPPPREVSVPRASGEFKITDMSGKTLMISRDSIKAPAEALPAAPLPPAPAPPIDDDPADALFHPTALSPEEWARLQKLAGNQEKSGIVLRALVELLAERGLLDRGILD